MFEQLASQRSRSWAGANQRFYGRECDGDIR